MPLPSRETLRRAELVFRAKVARIGATTMAALPASDATIVVSVEEVYRAPEVLRLIVGKSITVVLSDTRPPDVGQDVLFLAKGWLYGESIAVIEVGREQGQVDPTRLTQHITADTQAAKDEALGERIANATLIVAGSVLETRVLEIPGSPAVSEHVPMWAEAVIQVTTVERGGLPGKQVVVLYPESRDVMWYQAPKFRRGQTGVWILRSEPLQGLERVGLTALHPLDFQPMDELEHIRTLIRETR